MSTYPHPSRRDFKVMVRGLDTNQTQKVGAIGDALTLWGISWGWGNNSSFFMRVWEGGLFFSLEGNGEVRKLLLTHDREWALKWKITLEMCWLLSNYTFLCVFTLMCAVWKFQSAHQWTCGNDVNWLMHGIPENPHCVAQPYQE